MTFSIGGVLINEDATDSSDARDDDRSSGGAVKESSFLYATRCWPDANLRGLEDGEAMLIEDAVLEVESYRWWLGS